MFMNNYIISEAILRVPFFKCAKQFFTTHHKSISLIAAFLMFRWEIIIKLPIKSLSTMIYYLQLGSFLNDILTCFSYSKYYSKILSFLGKHIHRSMSNIQASLFSIYEHSFKPLQMLLISLSMLIPTTHAVADQEIRGR